ncbi:MAG: hypothetical protein GY820_30905 [Gammaproteobacteria bacterium]|nr:hypothetical protein [Gammaproteobacteria bacterium]
MQRYETAVLLFAKQKVSGCFRTQQYAEAYCRISSYLQTMAHQGYNPLVAIQMAISGEIYAEGGDQPSEGQVFAPWQLLHHPATTR